MHYIILFSLNRSHGLPPLPESVLLRMAWEAGEGLAYWQRSGLCHPDVAARSFMVTGDMTVVIGDYGTHSFAYKEDFVEVGDQILPVRWCAPEYLNSSSKETHHTYGM